ncbi:uncharacterized protein BCR38DRAFT_213167 [Pseudomassariella vexata]|uniref:Uncharacterized protein n=1 Tax=Pseudomassariella vexata TaxID=1141098 RepID=A0A1Y2DYR6_9PEZI|nr:uncharacterized protein BCR38DRAFT_213167 [Pseudomassariella vexata]ORY64377.1 hypothetical protein BCR38DRAFT_213167 [Pseudomassariella vexata]
MASKMSYIPRFLLPQYGPLWRTTTQTGPFARHRNAEIGQVLVRYASKTTKAAATKTTTTKATAAAVKAFVPKSAPTKTIVTKPAASKAATPKTPTSSPAVKAAATRKSAAQDHVVKTTAPAAAPKAPPVDPSKPIVLEKPEKFNPPSHGARLPRSTPKHYGSALNTEEVQIQKRKEYPGLPPPENTWSHWFLNNRNVHLCITLGTLTSLAIYTFILKFNATSAYADMIPPISDFTKDPVTYVRTCIEVLRLHEEHESAITAEKRRRKVDDVTKRNEYRKAHGLDAPRGFGDWLGNGKTEASSAGLPADESKVAAPAAAPTVEEVAEPKPQPDLYINPDGSRKKFWGIF